ncbi:midasin-like [Ornithodoros turicata]|uniref:midasin-like n=1 Tax=Ornithodoros turicata TaxID=34597 RepID=UPI00313A2169
MEEDFQFDVVRATELFCQQVPQHAKELKQYLTRHGPLLEALSHLLVSGNQKSREALCRLFRPLLPEFLSRLSQGGNQRHLCLALGDLLSRYPEVSQFAELYLEGQCLLQGHDSPPRKKARGGDTPERAALRCSLQLLQRLPQVVTRWDWGALAHFLGSGGLERRWFACQCYSLLVGMDDQQRHQLLYKFIGPKEISNLDLRLAIDVTIDGPQASSALSSTKAVLSSSDLSAKVECIAGILLPVATDDSTEPAASCNADRVPIASGQRSLRLLAEWVAQGGQSGGALLTGPVGCGKTWLVEHLAARTGHRLLTVQLGDQTDSHTLLGGYVCSQLPGKFIWNDGPLARALKNGYWLLLEDLDLAPGDVSGLLVPVLRGGAPAGLPRAPGFRIFATLRWPPTAGSAGGIGQPQHHKELPTERLWRTVVVEHPPKEELRQIMVSRWPVLKPLADRILDLFTILRNDSPAIKRALSLRDLCRLCSRMSRNFSLESRELALGAFQDALDCFCQSVRDVEARLSLAATVGARFQLTKAQAQHYCSGHKPAVTETETTVVIGRATLPRSTLQSRGSAPVFAHTHQSLTLLERIAVAVTCAEPVLLVGETGIGKTAAVQYLAHLTGRELSVVNLSQASDSVDLVGGFKPLELKLVLAPLREDFERLFSSTFSQSHNAKFLGHITACFLQRRWQDLFGLMLHTQQSALKRLKSQKERSAENVKELRERWLLLGRQLRQLQAQHAEDNSLAFAFVQGTLVRALESGTWILLDEVNLAEVETLECLNALLEGGSLVLFEKGEQRPVRRHKDFRLFACMNPATDVGKRDLPVGVRNRFTELYLEEPLESSDLELVVRAYVGGLARPRQAVDLYLELRKLAETTLSDGTGRRPHYSLRTLCRALQHAASDPCQNLQRSLYEGFCLSFLTALNRESHPMVETLIGERLLRKKARPAPPPAPPPSCPRSVLLEGYWVGLGPLEPHELPGYVLTPTVCRNLRDLARAVACGRHPVLLQGETSAGKTSLVQWLAARTGHICVRVNNHEHTDLQEYVGTYGTDPEDGRLVFKEGVLVEAMRKGHWIILDELNLACSEILEALNRVLDDNRELFVAETQQTVKAHPGFMLFATQNPPGHYGGRKVLSRAFRNRFLELHFEELPPKELEDILHERCALPPSYSKKLVAVLLELQVRRRESGVFAGKRGYMTLRDLFRWAERYRLTTDTAEKFHDWEQHLADEGYMLLAGRVRRPQEAEVIMQVLEQKLKRKVDPEKLFAADSPYAKIPSPAGDTALPQQFRHLVWTSHARRLAVLLGRALHFGEPVLLVGDTGCGKTTTCQLWAALKDLVLHCVNCHMHSEAGDLLGGLRPARGSDGKLFEWAEGPLVTAVRTGQAFLLDEISLADDAVLERLNSLLEPQRTLLLAEQNEALVAHPEFRFMATMNPAGDFGKKELSPALRNRFTEIWCPSDASMSDMSAIVEHNVCSDLGKDIWGPRIADFVSWLGQDAAGRRCVVSIRDILAWVEFMNLGAETATDGETLLSPGAAYVHGACLVFLDATGGAPGSSELRGRALKFLAAQLGDGYADVRQALDETADVCITWDEHGLAVGPFLLTPGTGQRRSPEEGYTLLKAGTPRRNALRLARAMQLCRPLLLEGDPGVGKTSLVTTLAAALGHSVTRINLSEHTDILDLFGADLPVEGASGGQFAWRDGPLLRALKEGHWILLDELNLASQSVLEGLNACLDHRGEVFVPELNRTFRVKAGQTRIFGCQNPHAQGGGRKGLPRSFRNRFTQVHLAPLTPDDYLGILGATCPSLPDTLLSSMVEFNWRLVTEVCEKGTWGCSGGPWQFNLRDLSRWAQLTTAAPNSDPALHVELLYASRMRSSEDRHRVRKIFAEVFGREAAQRGPQVILTETRLHVGLALLPRLGPREVSAFPREDLRVLHRQASLLEGIALCLEHNLVPLLVGPSGNGKGSAVRLLAHLSGRPLAQLHVTSDMDTTELLGGFQQVDLNLQLSELLQCAVRELQGHLLASVDSSSDALLSARHQLQEAALSKEVDAPDFLAKLDRLEKLLQGLPLHDKGWKKDVVSQLAVLREAARRGGALSGGGQFEWRDGVLVRSLLEGSWLLVENVNFCSAAVLDRLNGLLEPGGVLAMTEQGVVGEALRVIVPHPDFRLILAMDPKNGEISQAMRNRTVETFVPGEEDGEPLDPWDGMALVATAGLAHTEALHRVLCAHSAVQQVNSGFHRRSPSLLELHAALSLAAQRIGRGCSVADALRQSMQDIYVSNLPSRDAERIQLALEEALEGTEACQVQAEIRSLISAVTSAPLSTRILHYTLAQVQEDSLPLCAALVNNTASELLPVTLPSSPVGLSFSLLSVAARLFLERASAKDLEARLGWMDHLLSKFPEQGHWVYMLGRCLSEALAGCVQQLSDSAVLHRLELEELPIDLYQCPEVRSRWSAEAQQVSSSSLGVQEEAVVEMAFRVQLALRHAELVALQEKNLPKDGSLLWASIYKKHEAHPAISHLEPLLKTLQVALDSWLTSTSIGSAEIYRNAKAALWCFHSWVTACTTLREAEPWLGSLAVHWAWLRKSTLNQLYPEGQLPSELAAVVARLEADLAAELVPCLRTQVGRRLGLPRPLRDPECLAVYEMACRLSQQCLNLMRGHPATVEVMLEKGPPWLAALGSCLGATLGGQLPSVDLASMQADMDALQKTDYEDENPLVRPPRDDLCPRRHLEPLCAFVFSIVEAEVLRCHLLPGNCEARYDPLVCSTLHPLHQMALDVSKMEGIYKGGLSVLLCEHLSHQRTFLRHSEEAMTWKPPCYVSEPPCLVTEPKLQDHLVYLNPTVTSMSCMLAVLIVEESSSSSAALGSSPFKCQEADQQKAILWRCGGRLFDSSRFWTVQADVLRGWFRKLVSSVPGFPDGVDPVTAPWESWGSSLDVQQKTSLDMLREAASRVSSLHEEDSNEFAVGTAWALVGLSTLTLMVPWEPLDPAHKVELKLGYTTQQLNQIQEELSLRSWAWEARTGRPWDSGTHPALSCEAHERDRLQRRALDLRSKVASRPKVSQYLELARQLRHHSSTMGSLDRVRGLLDGLRAAWEAGEAPAPNVASWLRSQVEFADRLRLTFPAYRDIFYPFLCGLNQLIHGMQILCHLVHAKHKLSSIPGCNQLVGSTFAFPCESHPASQLITEPGMEILLSTNRKSAQRWLKATLLQLLDGCLLDHSLGTEWFAALHPLLAHVSSVWGAHQEELRQKEEAERSLYEYRHTAPEEEDYHKHFPSYAQDFEDLAERNLLDDQVKPPEKPMAEDEKAAQAELLQQDLVDVWRWHGCIVSRLARSTALILPVRDFGAGTTTGRGHMAWFLLRYRVLQDVMREFGHVLDSSLDKKLLGSNLVAASSFQWAQQQVPSATNYDFYKDANVAETSRCTPVLNRLATRVRSLLQEFPDHPGLCQILKICYRILGFSVGSSVMKVLTGLELVLSTAQDWETNAHRGVTLRAELDELTALIIHFRKLELGCWSGCLDTVARRRHESNASWWCYLHDVLAPLLLGSLENQSELDDARTKLLGELLQLLEQSHLGDFEARLQLVATFLCHVLSAQPTRNSRSMASLLYNVYHFYRQYLQAIRAKLEADRKPIEKDLKEFVKIVRWKDVSFWAVKQTIEKSHKTLHRHMKSFEKVLEQRASDAFIIQQNDEDDVWEDPKQTFQILSAHTEITCTSKRLTTMKQLLEAVLPHRQHWDMAAAVDQVACEVVSTVKEFAKDDEVEEPDKEKRKKNARLMHQCKRKALTDLFKALTTMGLSYRKGLVAHKEVGPRTMLAAPAADVEGSLLQVGNAPKALVDGCHKYYFRSVAQLAAFERAAAAPSKELELGALERCKGFSLHLAALVLSQRKSLCRSLRDMVHLRNVLSSLARVKDDPLPSQQYLHEWTQRVNEVLLKSTLLLEQFELLLRSCPPASQPVPPWLPGGGAELENASYGDPVWTRISETVASQLRVLEAQSQLLEPLHTQELKGRAAVDTLQSIVDKLSQVAAEMEQVQAACGPALGGSLGSLVELLESVCRQWEPSLAVQEASNEAEQTRVADAQGSLVARLLLAVQEVHAALQQGSCGSSKEVSESTSIEPAPETAIVDPKNVPEDEHQVDRQEESIPHGCLTQESLEKALNCLALKQVSVHASRFIQELTSSGQRVDRVTIALLEEYLTGAAQQILQVQLLAHRATLKLLYVLLSVFTSLATKGFCLPEEFKEELLKEGASEFQDIEEGGLGEGEGAKDVSDRLESEDQLEGTQGEKEEKRDSKEEEHGVEMSEDFAADAKAPEQQEDQENNEDDGDDRDEDELEDQMGEVEDDAAEKLDKQLWESEGEEEEEENEADGGGQDQTQEEQLKAKEGLKDREKDPSRREKETIPKDEADPFNEEEGDQDEYQGEREDPYKTQQEQEQAPEPMELPDDIQLDDDEAMDDDDDGTLPGEEEKGEEDGKEELPEEEGANEEGEEEDEKGTKEGNEFQKVDEPQEMEEEGQEKQEVPDEEGNQPEKQQEDAAQHSARETSAGQEATQAPCGMSTSTGEENVQSGEQGSGSQEDHTGRASTADQGQLGNQTSQAEEKGPAQPQKKRSMLQGSEDRALADDPKQPARRRNLVQGDAGEEKANAELFRHVREEEETDGEVALSVATESQAQNRWAEDEDTETEDFPMLEDENEETKEQNQKPVDASGNAASTKETKEKEEEEAPMEIEGEEVLTAKVERGNESSFFSRPELLQATSRTEEAVSQGELPPPVAPSSTDAAREAWEDAERAVAPLVQELCEQLRLVLEPTKASKLRGDFRTGKRLNMRKVIAYIASQFRKDKIWLRRTRPSRRHYHVVLAVDDSRSMGATGCGPLALQSLALLAQSLQLLEAGDLALLSFGEQVRLLHPLGRPWTTEAGAAAAAALNFEQERTRVGPLLRAAQAVLEDGAPGARLLLIVSDGRGLRSEGDEGAAVREALSKGIFMVFLVLDNPNSKDSILDIRMPVFRPSGEVEILSYMEQFPFPFYVILRDVAGMPTVLGEALRQWLELVSND